MVKKGGSSRQEKVVVKTWISMVPVYENGMNRHEHRSPTNEQAMELPGNWLHPGFLNGQRRDRVQRMLDHKNLRSTQLYADMAEYQVRQALEMG